MANLNPQGSLLQKTVLNRWTFLACRIWLTENANWLI